MVKLAESLGIYSFQGSENVMARVLNASNKYNADYVVEITGDCPIIDPEIVEQTVETFLSNKVDYLANNHIKSYPYGMDVQIFSKEILFDSYSRVKSDLEKEHVTLHIRNHPELYKHFYLIAPLELRKPNIALTLDEIDDYLFLKITEKLLLFK